MPEQLYRSIKVGAIVSFFTSMLLWIMIVLMMPKFSEKSYLLLILALFLGYFSGYTCGAESKMRRFSGTYLGGFLGTLFAIIFLFEVTGIETFAPFFGLEFKVANIHGSFALGLLFGSFTGLLTAIGGAVFKPITEKKEEIEAAEETE